MRCTCEEQLLVDPARGARACVAQLLHPVRSIKLVLNYFLTGRGAFDALERAKLWLDRVPVGAQILVPTDVGSTSKLVVPVA